MAKKTKSAPLPDTSTAEAIQAPDAAKAEEEKPKTIQIGSRKGIPVDQYKVHDGLHTVAGSPNTYASVIILESDHPERLPMTGADVRLDHEPDIIYNANRFYTAAGKIRIDLARITQDRASRGIRPEMTL